MTMFPSEPDGDAIRAAFAVEAMLSAGLSGDVVGLLPGRGESIGAALVVDTLVAGFAFTGSTEIASIGWGAKRSARSCTSSSGMPQGSTRWSTRLNTAAAGGNAALLAQDG